jgi:23S rRNA (cytosine1962-C5)-methyltransferase
VRPPAGGAGVVHVVDERGAVVGMALWSPASQISLRLLTHAELADRRGRSGGSGSARPRRTGVRWRSTATAYRLVHGEADGLPSLVVDRYDDLLVVQLLSAGLEDASRPRSWALIDELRRRACSRGTTCRCAGTSASRGRGAAAR